ALFKGSVMGTSWWNWFRKAQSRPAGARRPAVRPRLEELESRLTPSSTSVVVGRLLVVTGEDTGNVITLNHANGSTFVDGSPFADTTFDSIVINSGKGNDHVDILATARPVQVQGNKGDDTVILSNGHGVQDITGRVTVLNNFGFTDLLVGNSSDPAPRHVTLDVQNGFGTITGLAPAVITFLAQDTR